MPKYQLLGYTGRGRAEIVRWVFAAANVPYENCTFEIDQARPQEQWQQKLDETTYKKFPELVIDGKPLGQSGAIVRYLGRTYGLVGSNEFENAKLDQYVEMGTDIFNSFMAMQFTEDEKKKGELSKALYEKDIPIAMKCLENDLKGKQWLVGSKLTVADLAIQNAFDIVFNSKQKPTCMDGFPNLKQHNTKVRSDPKLAKYLSSRASCDYLD